MLIYECLSNKSLDFFIFRMSTFHLNFLQYHPENGAPITSILIIKKMVFGPNSTQKLAYGLMDPYKWPISLIPKQYETFSIHPLTGGGNI
jgi:hypothetical protein